MKNRSGVELTLYKFRGGLLCKWRAFYWTILRNHESELCYDCGRPYILWWCDDAAMWSRVTGYSDNGLCCPTCFDTRADAIGLVLDWRPTVLRMREAR